MLRRVGSEGMVMVVLLDAWEGVGMVLVASGAIVPHAVPCVVFTGRVAQWCLRGVLQRSVLRHFRELGRCISP